MAVTAIQRKEKLIERIFLLIAFSSIFSLFIIALFIFAEGLPLIWKVGLKDFLFSTRWAPTKGHFGIFAMIVSSFWVRGFVNKPVSKLEDGLRYSLASSQGGRQSSTLVGGHSAAFSLAFVFLPGVESVVMFSGIFPPFVFAFVFPVVFVCCCVCFRLCCLKEVFVCFMFISFVCFL